LRNLGYEVIEAENGVAAMGVITTRADIDLLFSDVVMPGGMNGRQLADAALAVRPGIRILFTSGYTENAIVHHGRLDQGVHLLTKPYRAIELARKIRKVID
jgi:CheY-like chemotaxis protein